jgi:two-component system response regulator FixJ
MNNVPTVYLVDHDPATRQSTSALLESAGLPSQPFDSAEAFVERVPADSPGCLILDFYLPGMTGLDLIDRMRERAFSMPIVMASAASTVPLAVEGMKRGLYDFFEKPVDPDRLLSTVRAALDLDAQRRATAANVNAIRAKLATLTAREHELLELIVRGLPNKNIATQLSISIKTVENHRAHLMAKTGAANAADLVRMRMQVAEG